MYVTGVSEGETTPKHRGDINQDGDDILSLIFVVSKSMQDSGPRERKGLSAHLLIRKCNMNAR